MISSWEYLEQLIDLYLLQLDTYSKTMEPALKMRVGVFIARDHFHGKKKDEQDNLAKAIEEDEVLKNYVRIANRSLFLMAYSTFELGLMLLCGKVKQVTGQALSVNDVKGNFNGADQYLKIVAGIKMSSYSAQWESIQKYRQVRNILAHKGGFTGEISDELFTYIKKTPGLSIEECDLALDGNHMLKPSLEYCGNAIQCFRDYFPQLITELEHQLPHSE